MHTYRRENENGEQLHAYKDGGADRPNEYWAVGFIGGTYGWRPVAKFRRSWQAAAYVAYLNGGGYPGAEKLQEMYEELKERNSTGPKKLSSHA